MPSVVSEHSTKPARRFRFSLSTALMFVAIMGLTFALIDSQRRLAQTEKELETHRPLSLKEVASQFEQGTTLGPISTTVRDVRYSPDENAYRISFSWTNRNTAQTWSTDVMLRSDGFGQYYGEIRNTDFIKPLGHPERYLVGVQTPSGFEQEVEGRP